MRLAFTREGWDDYLAWKDNRHVLRQIHKLIADIQRNCNSGLGKPEPLRADWAGWWSRRIDNKHRLIYRVNDQGIEIAQCGGHYGDH